MRSPNGILFLVVLAFLLIFARAIAQQDVPQPNFVTDLTDATFDEKVGAGGEWLVELRRVLISSSDLPKNQSYPIAFLQRKSYAPWCGACKRFGPLYNSAAFAMKQYDRQIWVAKVNIDDNPALMARFVVTALPSFFHIKDRKVREVVFDRESAQGVLDLLQKSQWKDVKVWDGAVSPFSILGRTLGWIGATAVSIINHGNDIMRWFMYAVVAWFVGGIALLFFRPSSQDQDVVEAPVVVPTEKVDKTGKKGKKGKKAE
ncbi:hypothetical protein BC938DRAFT_478432 [Jimgerdemannia flammicorona]|uniref:Thioredoxin domain-containing protein n=1 Tax=Jimgerdemannia flammicorona TaxID=994334 RepID=A0A433QYB7_9FUNG|nr:hypothetical protein BC938DRAFT_478432 [Jimgerdemannia flammicorona]